MAGWNVVGRTDEMLHDFRLWCSQVASVNPQQLHLVCCKLGIQDDANCNNRDWIADQMLDSLNDIKEEVFRRPPEAVPNDVERMENQPSGIFYSRKRREAKRIVFSWRQNLMLASPVAEPSLCPPIYARYEDKWQSTTFTDTFKNSQTRIAEDIPEWVRNDGHEVVRFLTSESERFHSGKHLSATNALYVIAVKIFKSTTDSEEIKDEGELQEDDWENPIKDGEPNHREASDRPPINEESCDIEARDNVQSEDDKPEEEGEETKERKRIKTDEEEIRSEEQLLQDDDEQQDERVHNGEMVEKHPTEEEVTFPDDLESGDDEEEEYEEGEETEEDDKVSEAEEEAGELNNNEVAKVHYYVGQTLRNIVKRCQQHCRSAKLLLDEAAKDNVYHRFEDYGDADSTKKVLLVDAYLAAAKAVAIAHPRRDYKCAVFVVRHFVDRKNELIRCFGLSDMRQGLNGGKAIQTKMTDHFGPVAGPHCDDDDDAPDDDKKLKTEDMSVET